jgi:hypothetical protein
MIALGQYPTQPFTNKSQSNAASFREGLHTRAREDTPKSATFRYDLHARESARKKEFFIPGHVQKGYPTLRQTVTRRGRRMTFAKVFTRARKRHKKEFLPLASAAKPALPSPACDAMPQPQESFSKVHARAYGKAPSLPSCRVLSKLLGGQ